MCNPRRNQHLLLGRVCENYFVYIQRASDLVVLALSFGIISFLSGFVLSRNGRDSW